MHSEAPVVLKNKQTKKQQLITQEPYNVNIKQKV